MELVHRRVSWTAGRYLNGARERVAAMLARTRWMGNPQTLPPSRIVSPMSEEWVREFENSPGARRGNNE